MTTVGIIGAGHIGSTLAQGLVDRGYDVVIAKDESVRTVDVPDDLAAALASAGLAERFAALGDGKAFVRDIECAERTVSRRLFAGDPDPFRD